MTTKPRVRKFRIRRSTPLTVGPPSPSEPAQEPAEAAGTGAAVPAAGGGSMSTAVATTGDPPQQADSAALAGAEAEIDAIRREGLTGRQLRLARRVAQKHGIAATSDFDAVRQLRANGIDPFQRTNVLQLVVPDGKPAETPEEGKVQLPQTIPARGPNLPSTERAEPSPAESRASEIRQIQQDLARRRRRKLVLLGVRLAIFVLLPTIVAGWYFYRVATPMYGTHSEFVIQQAESQAAAGLGGLFQGTSMATQQDSITVQSYLTSRAALARLDAEHGFREHFSQDFIDPVQRLPADASNEETFDLYRDHVQISYDPTEGIVKMEVIAADPETSQEFSEALIGYAEEQVDQLTQRLREDAMAGARESYEQAEARRADALERWLEIQQDVQQIDPVGETQARTSQISALETERQQLQLQLQTRLSVPRPNEAQVEALRSEIANVEALIADLRNEMTQASEGEASLAAKNTELRLAEENYTFQTVMVQQALTQMEAARVEANRQVRYLSLGVEPVAPDEPTYPRAFENTILAFLIFAGIYLMISLTSSILREQVTA